MTRTRHRQANAAFTVSREYDVLDRVTNIVYAARDGTQITERCAAQGAAYGDTNSLRTVRRWYPANAPGENGGRLMSVRSEDGSLDVYSYAHDGDGNWVETVTRLHEEAPELSVMRTTRDVKVYSPLGYLLEKRTDLLIGEEEWTPISQVRYTRNEDGKVLREEDFTGRATVRDWDSYCCGMSSETSPDGVRTEYLYDEEGRVAERTRAQPSPVTTVYEYDGLGREVCSRVTNRVEHLGYLPLRTEYDILGRVTAKSDRLGNWTRYRYLDNGKIMEASYPNGRIIRKEFDLCGRLVSMMNMGGGSLQCSYPSNSFHVIANSSQWWAGYKDMVGQLIRKERSGFAGSVLTDSCRYDVLGRKVVEITDEKPGEVYAYNSWGQLESVTDFRGRGWRKREFSHGYAVIDGNIWETNFVMLSSSDAPDAKIISGEMRQLTGLTTNIFSRTVKIDERGDKTESFQTQGLNNLQYNVDMCPGCAIAITNAYRYGIHIFFSDTKGALTEYSYDGLLRCVSDSMMNGISNEMSYNQFGNINHIAKSSGEWTTYLYDRYGQIKHVFKSDGSCYDYEFDIHGRKTYEGGDRYPIRYLYDTNGNLRTLTTYRGTNTIGDIVSWEYDSFSGLMTNELYADGSSVSFRYTNTGRISEKINARGITTRYLYDDWGALTNICYSDTTPAVKWMRDSMGNATNIVDGTGEYSLSYDLYGDLTRCNHELWRLEFVTDRYGRDTGYGLYEGDSLVMGVTQHYSPTGDVDACTAFDLSVTNAFSFDYYGGRGLPGRLEFPNGITESREYLDFFDAPVSVKLGTGDETVADRVYSYGMEGRLLFSSSLYQGGTGTIGSSFSYNARGELSSATIGSNTFSYVYDMAGNRACSIENGIERRYVANALNQYTSITENAFMVFIPEYDADGNQTKVKTQTGVWSVSYDAENRPVLFFNGDVQIQFSYDYEGRCAVSKIWQDGRSVARRRFLYNEDSLVAVIDGEVANTTSFVSAWIGATPETKKLVAFRWGANNWFFPSSDNVDSVREISDIYAEIAERYFYTPFGKMLERGGTPPKSPFLFNGEYYSRELGLYIFRYRFYNPLDGRWVTRDPLGYDSCSMLYSMVDNRVTYEKDLWGFSRGVLNGTIKKQLVQRYLLKVEEVKCGEKCDKDGKIVCVEPCLWETTSKKTVSVPIRYYTIDYSERWNREEEAQKVAKSILQYLGNKPKGVIKGALLSKITRLKMPTDIPFSDEADLVKKLVNNLSPHPAKREIPEGSGNFYTVSESIEYPSAIGDKYERLWLIHNTHVIEPSCKYNGKVEQLWEKDGDSYWETIGIPPGTVR